jgi:hypothetical protein
MSKVVAVTPANPDHSEKVAARDGTVYAASAVLLAIAGGLLLPIAAVHGLNRAILVWLTICLGCGLLLSSRATRAPLPAVMAGASISAVLWGTVIVAYAVQRMIGRAIDPTAPAIPIEMGPGLWIDPLAPGRFAVLLALVVVYFIGSTVVLTSVVLAGRAITAAARSVYRFGPEGFERTRRLVIAIAALLGAVVTLWASFS